MKFLRFSMFDAAKTAEMSQVSDKVMANLPPGLKVLAAYTCLGNPFPATVPPNALISVAVMEAESAEAIVATAYPAMLAGAQMWYVPVMEVSIGAAAEQEKKYRA